MERNRYTDEKGHEHLTLLGPEGGVSLVVMPTGVTDIDPVGVLTVHYQPTRQYLAYLAGQGRVPQPCPDFGGACCPSNAFRAGQEAADYLTRGHENHAWGVLEDWYASCLTGSEG